MTKENPKMKCSTCKYWSTGRERKVVSGDDGYKGQCRRQPPAARTNSFQDDRWPYTWNYEFCGEWAASARHEIDLAEIDLA
jgi:hypothetical protein